MSHISVLPRETIELLALRPGAVVLDGTLGSGGHAQDIIKSIPGGVYVGIDVDQGAIERSRAAVESTGREHGVTVHLRLGNFRNLDTILHDLGFQYVDGILLDLGWAMEQFEEGQRGFSFDKDEPLLMTLSEVVPPGVETARDIVNTYGETELADLIYTYGEEQFSRRIARGIVEARKEKSIVTTRDLVAVIESAVPAFYTKRRIHPATKTFQALRIAVNDELGALKEVLAKGVEVLHPQGRLAVITFHSLEDRIVKQTFRTWAQEKKGLVLTKKPIIAGDDEIRENKRARSAKLRGFEKAH